jgi:hypothetical protein
MSDNAEKTVEEHRLEDRKVSHDDAATMKGDAAAIERAELLANLPDPDEGKTEEERKAIVSCSLSAACQGFTMTDC